VLVHAAAGALGQLVAQWARALGATVIGTVGAQTKSAAARACCDDVVVIRDGRFADAVLDLTGGRGANLVIDGLGEPAREETLRALATAGHWISVGQAGGAWRPLDPAWLTQKSITLSRPVVFHFSADAARRRQMAGRVFDALREGVLRPQITRYALSAASRAHADLEERRTTGQLVLLA
jgi:NADPH:quinone reductase-like Zn-dependent oxidoreductase